jgi:four helix bundle protein
LRLGGSRKDSNNRRMQQHAARGSHRDLIVWQKAMDLAVAVYEILAVLPSIERHALGMQIRRAASSIPANIAEGSARRTTPEFVAFLHFARGSLAELDTHLRLAERVGFLDSGSLRTAFALADEVGRLINGVLRGLRQRQTSS